MSTRRIDLGADRDIPAGTRVSVIQLCGPNKPATLAGGRPGLAIVCYDDDPGHIIDVWDVRRIIEAR